MARSQDSFVLGIEKGFASVFPNLSIDVKAKQLIADHIKNFVRIVTEQASNMYEKKDELQPADIQNIISNCSESDALKAASNEGCKRLLMYDTGLLESGWSSDKYQMAASVSGSDTSYILGGSIPDSGTEKEQIFAFDFGSGVKCGTDSSDKDKIVVSGSGSCTKSIKNGSNPDAGAEKYKIFVSDLGSGTKYGTASADKDNIFDSDSGSGTKSIMNGSSPDGGTEEKFMISNSESSHKLSEKMRQNTTIYVSEDAIRLGPCSKSSGSRIRPPKSMKPVFDSMWKRTLNYDLKKGKNTTTRKASITASEFLKQVCQALVSIILSLVENSEELNANHVADAVFELCSRNLARFAVYHAITELRIRSMPIRTNENSVYEAEIKSLIINGLFRAKL